ncbi:MAG: ABC transporter permease [Prevotella sp.]|nr:ABC transporter permease [Prevotella sp.]
MIGALIRKEFIQFRRNSFLPKLVIVFPIMVMCVMPWVTDMEVDNIGAVVVDNDRTPVSGRLTERIARNNHFVFKGLRDSYNGALEDIERSSADLIIEIPRYYERDLARGAVPSVLVAANAVNGMKGSLGASYAASIITQNVSELAGMSQGVTPQASFSTLSLYNKHLDYKRFMIPALMSILMMMLCGFLPALNIVGEKEAGTIEQINVTPVSRFAFILAKLIPYWLIGVLVLSVCLVLAWIVYGITPAGNIVLIYVCSLLLALIFSGMGLIVSNYSDTMQQAIFVIWFFVVCMMLLSGLFTPISSMPDWAQTLTRFIPVSYYIDAMRTVFLRGGAFSDIAPQLLALCTFALIMDVWAVISYRKTSA